MILPITTLGVQGHRRPISARQLMLCFQRFATRPKLGRWTSELGALLTGNAVKPAREKLTLIRIFEELRERGYDGGYDAVRRYASAWAKERGAATAAYR
jgi:hypothetical protein